MKIEEVCEKTNEYLEILMTTGDVYDRVSQLSEQEIESLESYLKRLEFIEHDIDTWMEMIRDTNELNFHIDNLCEGDFEVIDDKVKNLMSLRHLLCQYDMYKDMVNDLVLTSEEYNR